MNFIIKKVVANEWGGGKLWSFTITLVAKLEKAKE